jgi:hypothetical protein
MVDEAVGGDGSWPGSWQEHELDQLRRLARLPLWQKLRWLEEMNRIIRHMRQQTAVPGTENAQENAVERTRGGSDA